MITGYAKTCLNGIKTLNFISKTSSTKNIDYKKQINKKGTKI